MNLTCLKSGIWQVELRIPSDVRVVLGRTRFAKSTFTRDKRQAASKALPILAEWQQLISIARQNPDLIRSKPCLLYTSPSPRDVEESRMPSSA